MRSRPFADEGRLAIAVTSLLHGKWGASAERARELERRGLAGPMLTAREVRCVARTSHSGRQLLLPPANWCLICLRPGSCRELLMAERGVVGTDFNGKSFEREFSLCEH